MSDTGGFTPIERSGADTGGFTPIEPTKPKTPQAQQPEQLSLVDRLWQSIVGTEQRPTMVGAAGKAIGHGLMNPIYGGAQIGARLMESPGGGVPEQAAAYVPPQQPAVPPGGSPPDPARLSRAVDRIAQQREAAYQKSPGVRQHPWASMGGELVGEMASSPNLVAGSALARAIGPGAGLLRNMGGGALGGALGGATQPVTGGDFAREKTKQVLGGAVMGAGGGAVGSALGGAVAPGMGPDASKLAAGGVQLTPGRMGSGMTGNIAKGMEDRFAGFPFLGDFIKNAQGRSFTSFNEATINQALDNIGTKLPKGLNPGTETVKKAGDLVSDFYTKTLSKIPNVVIDRDLQNALKAIQFDANQRPAVGRLVQNELKILSNKLKRGTFDGNEAQRAASELERVARELQNDPDAFTRMVSGHLREARSALYDAIGRQYPNVAPDLEKANNAWAMMVRVENAASRRAGSGGIFTPMDLLSASRSAAGGVRRREFSRGDSLYQDWAQAAQNLLPSKVPDSGTAGRLMAEHPLASLGWGAMTSPAWPLYTSLGEKIVQAYRSPGATRSAARDLLGTGSIAASPGIGSYPWLPSPP